MMENIEKVLKMRVGERMTKPGNELQGLRQKVSELEASKSKRNEEEQRLRESEHRFKFLVDHCNAVVLILSKKGRIIFANKRTMDIFGYSQKELIGKSITSFLAKGSMRKTLRALAQEFLGRPQPELELQAKTKSGEIRYLSVAEGSAPIYENGKLMGVMISANDITERGKAEKERQEAERRFRDLWENAPVAYHTVDTKGLITNANQTEANGLGYAKEELVGKSIFEFILPEQRAEAATRFQQKIVGRRIPKAENRVFVKKDGSKINVAIDDSLERDGDGKVIGIRTTMVDITKLMIAEESLKKSEEHFRALVEKSGIAILIDDEEGNLLYCNSRYADNFGYSMEEMRGQPISAIVHSDDVERVMTYHRGRLQGKDVPSRYEFKGIRKDGTVIYLEVDASVLREGERLIGTRSYMWDITDRKLAEENLRKRSARLELVHHIQSGIPLSADIEAVLNQTAESIGKTLGYYKISVNLYDRATNEIEYLTGWNKTGLSLPRGHRQKLGQGLIGKAGLLKQTILANDVSKEADYIPYHLTETKAELVIPLLVQGHLIGVLDLQAAEVDAFSKEDIVVLESVASYIAFIIDRKKREEALQESEEKFRNLAEQSPNMIFINKKGRIIYANKKCEEVMGYKKEEIYSPDFNFLVLIAPEYRDEVKARFLKHMNGIEGDLLQYSLLTKEGKRIEVLQNSKLIDYEKDKAILGTVTDITERKRAEEILQESEERYKALFSEALDGICLANAETGMIIDCNNTMAAMVGRDRAELIGQHQAVLHPSAGDKEAFSSTFRQHLTDEEGQILETQIVTKTGEIRDVEIKANLLNLGGRKMLQGIFRDITERKRAEKALRESEAKLKEAQALGRIGNWEFDLDKQTIQWSDQVYRLYERDPSIGPPNVEEEAAYYSHEQTEKLHEYARMAVEQGRASEYDLEARLPSGRVAHFTAALRPIKGESGRIVKLFGTVQDITERKQTENDLRQASENIRQALGSIVNVVTATVEMKDPYTAGHQKRVADLARAIATEMSLSKDQIEGIRIAGTIHDLGKIFIPGEILSKPGKLSEDELKLIRLHSQVGFDILKDIKFPWPIAQIVYQHHERMNGCGYPRGIKGEQLLIEARILEVADVVEAMSSHRPYRPALGIAAALEEIEKNRSVLYDSDVVAACLTLFREKRFNFK